MYIIIAVIATIVITDINTHGQTDGTATTLDALPSLVGCIVRKGPAGLLECDPPSFFPFYIGAQLAASGQTRYFS